MPQRMSENAARLYLKVTPELKRCLCVISEREQIPLSEVARAALYATVRDHSSRGYRRLILAEMGEADIGSAVAEIIESSERRPLDLSLLDLPY